MPAAWLKWTAAGVWKPRLEWRCWWLYHWKKRWQNARPSSMEPNRPGNSGRYLSVLNCASEYGLSLEQWGREWLLVTPKVGQQQSHRLGSHGRTPIGVDGELVGCNVVLADRFAEQSLG